MCQKSNVSADEKLKDIINKCTQMDPDNRFQNVKQLKDTLLQCRHLEEENNAHISDSANGANKNQIMDRAEKLPPITFRYVVKTIPGFRSGNFLYAMFAILMYGTIIFAFGRTPFNKEYVNVSMYNKVVASALYVTSFIIPYMYLTNIADIARSFPKKTFKNRWLGYVYQIFAGGIWLLVIITLILLILR